MVGWSSKRMLLSIFATGLTAGLATTSHAQQNYSKQYSTKAHSPVRTSSQPPSQDEWNGASNSRFSNQLPDNSRSSYPATRAIPSKQRTDNPWTSAASSYVAAVPGVANYLDEPRSTREQRGAPPVSLGASQYLAAPPYPPGAGYAAPIPGAPESRAPFSRPYETNVAYNPGPLPATQNPAVLPQTPYLPPSVVPQDSGAAHRKSSGTLLGLLFSVALNLFLAWVTWDTHNRYQDLVDDFDELQERRGEPRIDSRSRTGSSRRRGRDYDGLPLETSAEPSM